VATIYACVSSEHRLQNDHRYGRNDEDAAANASHLQHVVFLSPACNGRLQLLEMRRPREWLNASITSFA
jgi:hypothetical protein